MSAQDTSTSPRDNGSTTGRQAMQDCEPNLSAPTFNLSKAMMGSAILVLPYAAARLGCVFSTVLLILMALATHLTLMALAIGSERSDASSYSELVQKRFSGATMMVLLQTAIFANTFGMCVAYLQVMLDTLISVAILPTGEKVCSGFLCIFYHVLSDDVADILLSRVTVLLVIVICVVTPLGLCRSMGVTALMSMLGVVAVGIVLVVMALMAAFGVHKGGLPDTPLWPWSGPGDLFKVLGVVPGMLCAYVCQQNVHSIRESMWPKTSSAFRRVSSVSVLTACALNVLVMLLGAAVFGGDAPGDLLKSLTTKLMHHYGMPTPLALICTHGTKLCFFLSMLGSFLVNLWPLRTWLNEVFPQSPDNGIELPLLEDGQTGIVMSSRARFRLNTVVIIVSTTIVAMLVTDLSLIISVVGTIGGTLISFIIPACIMLQLAGELGEGAWWRKPTAYLIIGAGVAAVFVGAVHWLDLGTD